MTHLTTTGAMSTPQAVPTRPMLRYASHAYMHPAVEAVVLAVVIGLLWTALVVLT